jgi:membrane protease YdiL (CAAX protease family)
VVGVVFSLARGRSGSLTPSIFLHVGYNACMMGSLYISTEHFHSINFILVR